MKFKAICILAFGVFLSMPSFSQILVGPIAGGQYSWVRLDEREDRSIYGVRPVYGFHAGGAVSFQVRKRFFLHTALLYSTKGKVIVGKEDELLRNDVRYRYIDVPIVYTVDFRGKLGGGKEFKYFFGVGPNVSYWLSGKGTLSTTDLSELSISEQEYTIAFKKDPQAIRADEMSVMDPNRIQLGLNIAAGIVFEPLPLRKIMLTARYELGHSFFSKTSEGRFQQTYYLDILRSRNHGVRLSLAYLIDLEVDKRKKGKSTIRKSRL